MEKLCKSNKFCHVFVNTVIISLGVASFALCIICEFKKSKKKELRLDKELCYLPQSPTFGYGIGCLICLSIAQILGSGLFIFCKRSCLRDTRKFKSIMPSFASILFFFSWLSFLIVIILIGTATSMSRKQTYGEGWLNNNCYLVKNGVYVGSGILVVITISLTLISYNVTPNKR